jgi:hypothetical protein
MYYREYSVSKFAKGGEIAKDIKVPKYILLNVSIEKIKQQELPRMEVIGGIKMIEYAKKYKIPPLRNDDYKLKIEDGKVYMLLTKDGQMAIRVASKSINDYLEKITKVANETFKDYISNKKFAKGGNLEGITEKDFANNRVIKKGNIEIELSKDYPTEYYAFFVDMSKDGGELVSVYANKNWNKVVKEIETFKYEKGGMVAKGGEIEDEFMGFNVMINTKKNYNKFKKFYISDADEMGDNTLFFSFDNEKNANKKIKEIENHFKELNIEDYFIQNVYSSEFN